MRYGKINPSTGYLMTCDIQAESDWIEVSNFAVDSDGELYEFYIDAQTPNLTRSVSKAERDKIVDAHAKVAKLEVSYSDNTYYGDNNSLQIYYKQLFVLKELNSMDKTKPVFTSNGTVVNLTLDGFRNLIALVEEGIAKEYTHIPIVTDTVQDSEDRDNEYFIEVAKLELSTTDMVAITARAHELNITDKINKVEMLYTKLSYRLHKTSSSLDQVTLRRVSDEAIKVQQAAYILHQSAIAHGIITDVLLPAQAAAVKITVEYDTFLSKLCDSFTVLIKSKLPYKTMYTKAEKIDLETNGLTNMNLDALYVEFGLTK